MSLKKVAWDDDAKSLRGSFINMVISGIYVVLIIVGAAFTKIATNLESMATFLLGFFGLSFSIWAGRKVIENMQNVTTVTDTINTVLQKVGVKIGDNREDVKPDEGTTTKFHSEVTTSPGPVTPTDGAAPATKPPYPPVTPTGVEKR